MLAELMALALLLLSPSLGKNNESIDEDGEDGGWRRKAKGEAKGSSKKKTKRGRSAGRGMAAVANDEGEGESSGVLDQDAMMRQLVRLMSPEDREEFFKCEQVRYNLAKR